MEESLTGLELQFKRVAQDLEFVEHRLDSEFRGRSDVPNIITLLKRIHALGPKLTQVRAKVDRLEERRGEVVMQTVRALAGNCAALSEARGKLATDTNSSDKENSGPVEALLATLSQCPWVASEDIKALQPAPAPTPTPAPDYPSSKAPFLTEALFLALPTSVRGRLKFAALRDGLQKMHALHAQIAPAANPNLNPNPRVRGANSSQHAAADTTMSVRELEAAGVKVRCSAHANILLLPLYPDPHIPPSPLPLTLPPTGDGSHWRDSPSQP